ncbi:MAG: serine/threonine protein kinase [Bacteroidia bacterium]|nr:serine/threonine protein kinase [Bacteroidia bacterium]
MTYHQYSFLQELGEGGMGKVYLAQHLPTSRLVVIKTLRPEYARDERFIQRLYTEARILAELNHPAIVQLYDFIVYDGVPYLVMEYVEGESLESFLKRSDSPPGLSWAYHTLKPIFQALAFAHSRDIVHRDIKPSNIMLSPTGAKLLDFGIAKALDADYKLTQTGTQVGTVLYMAPELIQGQKATPATDLYSLGIVLYECAFGRYPWDWEEKTLFQIYQTILSDPPPIPAHESAVVKAFFAKALAKAPTARYRSAQEMLEALAEVVQIPSSKPSTPSHPPFLQEGFLDEVLKILESQRESKTITPNSKFRVEALDSPPTYTRESLLDKEAEKEPSLWKYAVIGLGATAAAFFFHKPLGVLGWGLWALSVGGVLYGVLVRINFWTLLFSLLLGALGFFRFAFFPKVQRLKEREINIYHALNAEVERYRASFLADFVRESLQRHYKYIEDLSIEMAPLPSPEELRENLSPSEVFRLIKGGIRSSYPPRGSKKVKYTITFTVKKYSQPLRQRMPCKVQCGFFGLETCDGYRDVWYRTSWKERCESTISVPLHYEYDSQSDRLSCKFEKPPLPTTATECIALPETKASQVEYQGPCIY